MARIAGRSRPLGACALACRAEQLYRVAGRVLDDHLVTTHSVQDPAAEPGPCRLECPDEALQVRYLEHEAVPAAGLWGGSVRHGLPTAAPPAGSAQRQSEVAALEHREGRSGAQLFGEAQVPAVEGDRLI